MVAFSSLLILCLLPTCLGWGFYGSVVSGPVACSLLFSVSGHTLVLNIARKSLSLSSDQWNDLQLFINQEEPYFPTLDFESGSMATWMDYIRSSTGLFDAWHYSDIPYFPSDNPANFTPQISTSNNNITWALADIMATSLKSKSSSSWMKGVSLRFLFHLAGDIHQPLHCASLFSPQFPSGDYGGNDYKIDYTTESNKSITNLHYFFDSVGGLWTTTPALPISSSTLDMFNSEADDIMRSNPPSSFPQFIPMNINFTGWAQESHQLAISLAYQKFRYDQVINQTEAADVQVALKRQIALAGYRLATVIETANLNVSGPLPSNYTPSSSNQSNHPLVIGLIVFCIIGLPIAFFLGRLYEKRQPSASTDSIPLL